MCIVLVLLISFNISTYFYSYRIFCSKNYYFCDLLESNWFLSFYISLHKCDALLYSQAFNLLLSERFLRRCTSIFKSAFSFLKALLRLSCTWERFLHLSTSYFNFLISLINYWDLTYLMFYFNFYRFVLVLFKSAFLLYSSLSRTYILCRYTFYLSLIY